MLPLLLDTCAVIWLSQGEALARTAVDALRTTSDEGLPTFVSPITAWEVGRLVARNRLYVNATPSRWFVDVLQRGATLAELSPDVLIASSFLPGRPPRDPADRIIIATARDLAATIITRDRALLAYGEQGHVDVVEC